ncbi:DUF7344 domain-containing protein [Halosimplex halobium]|uniref:DUF7344 domain-containing protein n=1 Tax=Halosimplex halobium TaxID=3396618 RepID=UPI003F5527F6
MTIKTNDNTPGDIDAEQAVSGVFKLLSHHRRRIAVQYLATQVGTTSVSDVADQIALLEGEHTHDRYERICTSLFHTHLPMLANGGAIEYDRDRQVVELRDQAAGMLPYLEVAAD